MNGYLLKLIEQYEMANGLTINPKLYLDYVRKIKTWYESRKEIGKKFVEFLYYLELNQQYANVAEIGKGRLDSIVLNSSKTTIISPYINRTEEITNPFIPASLRIDEDGNPIFEYEHLSYKEKYHETIKLFFNTKEVILMLNNPYSNDELINWHQLTNNCHAEIIVGVFGNIHDKDMLTKIRLLKELRSRITGASILKFAIEENNYFNVLASNQYFKRR